jgi:ribonuclease III
LLLNTAFVHPSYSNEALHQSENNERLEFLGDSVLSLIVVETLYKRFPDFDEGKLSKRKAMLVSEYVLAQIAKEWNLGNLLWVGKGEKASGGQKRISNLANLVEAILGAMFLDSGLEAVKNWFLPIFEPYLERFNEIKASKDSKTALQEYTQKKFKQVPTYKLISEDGPEHEKEFVMEVSILNWKAIGRGSSKREAEREAAKLLIEKFGDRIKQR